MAIRELPRRPGSGTKGRSIRLFANLFRVDIDPELVLYHYDVVIEPDVPRPIKRKVMVAAVERYGTEFSGQFPVYDGQKGLYCHKRLRMNHVRWQCLAHSMCALKI